MVDRLADILYLTSRKASTGQRKVEAGEQLCVPWHHFSEPEITIIKNTLGLTQTHTQI